MYKTFFTNPVTYMICMHHVEEGGYVYMHILHTFKNISREPIDCSTISTLMELNGFD